MNRKIRKMKKDDYPSCSVTLVKGQSFDQAVTEGHYGVVSSEISAERFPQRGMIQEGRQIYLVNSDTGKKDSDRLIMEYKRINLYPAVSEELLALGAQHPQLQKSHPIIALGSVTLIEKQQRVLGLFQHGDKRRLALEWYLGLWPTNYRFAFVSEQRI